MLSVARACLIVMLRVVMRSVFNAGCCHDAECRYAECCCALGWYKPNFLRKS